MSDRIAILPALLTVHHVHLLRIVDIHNQALNYRISIPILSPLSRVKYPLHTFILTDNPILHRVAVLAFELMCQRKKHLRPIRRIDISKRTSHTGIEKLLYRIALISRNILADIGD